MYLQITTNVLVLNKNSEHFLYLDTFIVIASAAIK